MYKLYEINSQMKINAITVGPGHRSSDAAVSIQLDQMQIIGAVVTQAFFGHMAMHEPASSAWTFIDHHVLTLIQEYDILVEEQHCIWI